MANTKTGKINQLTIGAALAAVLILLGVLKIFVQPEKPVASAATATIVTAVSSSDDESTIEKARKTVVAERKRKAIEAIAEHEMTMAGNFGDEETADRMMAVGNLHHYQLGDYYSAIESYRSMIRLAPDHSQTPQAYIEIAYCYEQLGDEVQAIYVYREMVDTLDPSLQHVQFAELKLESG